MHHISAPKSYKLNMQNSPTPPDVPVLWVDDFTILVFYTDNESNTGVHDVTFRFYGVKVNISTDTKLSRSHETSALPPLLIPYVPVVAGVEQGSLYVSAMRQHFDAVTH